MRGIRFRLRTSILLLLMSAFPATGQTSPANLVTFLTTNRFPDGSTIEVESVSYGLIHPSLLWGEPRYIKSASPTIMFTTSRHASYGRSLDDPYSDDLFTKAEALDSSGNWHPLHYDGPNYYEHFGPTTEFWETWDFPKCPEPSASIHVRILTTRLGVNSACVELNLPNDAGWRERSIKEQRIALRSPLGDELFGAALHGDMARVKELIALGANPDSCNSVGVSALATSCQQDHSDVVIYLLDHGADVNFHRKDKLIDRTALMVACDHGRHSMVHLLADRGAEVNVRGELGWTALIWASVGGDTETVKYLLGKGADPGIKDDYGKSAIELAEKTQNANRFEIIKILKSAQ